MGKYRISVFKTLLSSDGHPCKCLQFMIDIDHAKSAQRAIEAARCRYQRKVRIPDWRSIADIVEAIDIDAQRARRSPATRGPDRHRAHAPRTAVHVQRRCG